MPMYYGKEHFHKLLAEAREAELRERRKVWSALTGFAVLLTLIFVALVINGPRRDREVAGNGTGAEPSATLSMPVLPSGAAETPR